MGCPSTGKGEYHLDLAALAEPERQDFLTCCLKTEGPVKGHGDRKPVDRLQVDILAASLPGMLDDLLDQPAAKTVSPRFWQDGNPTQLSPVSTAQESRTSDGFAIMPLCQPHPTGFRPERGRLFDHAGNTSQHLLKIFALEALIMPAIGAPVEIKDHLTRRLEGIWDKREEIGHANMEGDEAAPCKPLSVRIRPALTPSLAV